jgi:hypothetical protein
MSVEITLNGDTLSRNRYSDIAPFSCNTHLAITAYPPSQNEYDSLTLRARDLAGNDTVATYVYKPGSDLSITFVACHPNPFTARHRDNRVIEPIRIAYMLTDDADRVDATIYTITGTIVRRWTFRDTRMTGPGYHEIVWDGKTHYGNRLANGVYYLSLKARNSGKRAHKTLKIAKCEGY